MHMGVQCFKIEQQEDNKASEYRPQLFKRLKA